MTSYTLVRSKADAAPARSTVKPPSVTVRTNCMAANPPPAVTPLSLPFSMTAAYAPAVPSGRADAVARTVTPDVSATVTLVVTTVSAASAG
ncbi:MAG: hypothetical protein IJG47_06130 [Microbacterium sp.]|nr:hypothetical protein [Microbacterium sp.]